MEWVANCSHNYLHNIIHNYQTLLATRHISTF